jgi:hypothetical protein
VASITITAQLLPLGRFLPRPPQPKGVAKPGGGGGGRGGARGGGFGGTHGLPVNFLRGRRQSSHACAQGVEAGAAGLRRGAAVGLAVAAAEGAGALVGEGGVRRGAVADSGVATSVLFFAWWVTIEFLKEAAALLPITLSPLIIRLCYRGNGVPSVAGWFAGTVSLLAREPYLHCTYTPTSSLNGCHIGHTAS